MAESQELEGYTAIPNRLLDALGGENGSTYSIVLFIARHTIGRQMKVGDAFYRVKEVCLSFDEFAKGRRKRDGSRMPDTSGLKYDDAIERGIQKAVAHGFINLVSTSGQRNVRVYTIPDRFWQAAGFEQAIKMLADTRIPDSYEQYYLVTTFTAGKTPAVKPSEQQNDAPTAGKSAAVSGQNASSHRNTASSSAAILPAEISHQPAPEQAPREHKHTSQHRVTNIEENIEAGPSPGAVAPLSISITEKEEHESPPVPVFSRGEQASLQAGESSESTDTSLGRKEAPAPARTAEPEAAWQGQRAAIDARRQAQEVERKATLEAERLASAAKEAEQRAIGKLQERYDALVLAKQKSEPGCPAWQEAQEELQEVKHQLAAYGWYL